jgi:hypothetical protein
MEKKQSFRIKSAAIQNFKVKDKEFRKING